MSAVEAGQYLTFSLGTEEYAVDILKVQEIRGFSPITPVPNMPSFVKGVMNLRGTVVPVVDLRTKLTMREVEPTPFTVIIMVRIGTRTIGLLVDAVSDVLSIPDAAIDAPPDFRSVREADLIKGTARVGDKLIVLLDIDLMLAENEAVARGA